MASPPHARRRALALLLLAVVVGVGAAFALHSAPSGPAPHHGPALQPGAVPGSGLDPLAYRPARRLDDEHRAALGLAHVLFAKSPGGAVATAARVAAWRPLVERAATAGHVDADTLEAIVFLESAGRADVQASNDLSGAVGLTQILAETGQNLLGMHIDVARSARLTRGIRRGRKVAARTRERRRSDERFDPAKALSATARYLRFARGKLHGRDDMAVVGYHMGVGNLQQVLARYGAHTDTPYAEVFFSASPLYKAAAYAKLASLGDDSSTYLWRIDAAKAIMRRWRTDRAGLVAQETLQTNKNSDEEVLHPAASTTRFADADALGRAVEDGTLIPLPAAELAQHGVRIDPRMGELAARLKQPQALYRALQPGALALLEYVGSGVRTISHSRKPLIVTSTARDEDYQRLLMLSNIEATHAYSLHTTGYTFDISRHYAGRRQALAFQFLLDRLTALHLIAWVREPGAIHVTVAGDADRLLRTR